MKINSNYKLREIAGEKMVVIKGPIGVDLTKVVMLNSSAELLWSSLQGKDFLREEAEDLLIRKYGFEKSQAALDAGEWIISMVKVGLIEY